MAKFPPPPLAPARVGPAAAPEPAQNSLLIVAVVVISALYFAREVLIPVTIDQRLGRLSNRLDAEMQTKILGTVQARVPMPTQDELAALKLERAKQHETAWRFAHVQTEGIVKANKALRDSASKMVAEGEPLIAMAAEQVKTATDRRERGGNIGLLGKPPSLKELGITPADARHARLMKLLSPEQFERYLEIVFKRYGREARRREHAALRKYIANLPLDASAPEDRDEVFELLWPR